MCFSAPGFKIVLHAFESMCIHSKFQAKPLKLQSPPLNRDALSAAPIASGGFDNGERGGPAALAVVAVVVAI